MTDAVPLSPEALDLLMPMHLRYDAGGRIVHAGPGLERIAGPLCDRALARVVRLRRPRAAATPAVLGEHAGRRLVVDLATPVPGEDGAPRQRMRAVAVPLGSGGGVLQLALGADLAPAVGRHALSASDFSPVDPVLDILYLLEAQSLVRGEMRKLATRLDRSLRLAEREAVTDGLTGLANRRAMDRRLGALAASGAEPFGVMHLDLDHFKTVNDTLGHAAGDAVLAEVAAVLRRETRRGDLLARVGGDEFVVVFPDCADRELLAGIARRILAGLARPIPFDGRECRVSGSIGIALSGDYAAPEPEALLADADAALYRSKRAGRARYAFHRGGEPVAHDPAAALPPPVRRTTDANRPPA
ncbi:GGDEF domain-containing protein [Jannaschia sp. W003]|uniref:GGDEF domain-containing protein n=1 Tax=Jannaschia sp. W003 TaxID=2867012 RepID=UPI0021A53BA1|nr:GGDEF domain-containing protein [Jannaschia sp. W003]UWQ21039.1 GGDEF domain-containing protein [Jannaschia sp. W003]